MRKNATKTRVWTLRVTLSLSGRRHLRDLLRSAVTWLQWRIISTDTSGKKPATSGILPMMAPPYDSGMTAVPTFLRQSSPNTVRYEFPMDQPQALHFGEQAPAHCRYCPSVNRCSYCGKYGHFAVVCIMFATASKNPWILGNYV